MNPFLMKPVSLVAVKRTDHPLLFRLLSGEERLVDLINLPGTIEGS